MQCHCYGFMINLEVLFYNLLCRIQMIDSANHSQSHCWDKSFGLLCNCFQLVELKSLLNADWISHLNKKSKLAPSSRVANLLSISLKMPWHHCNMDNKSNFNKKIICSLKQIFWVKSKGRLRFSNYIFNNFLVNYLIS